MKFRDGSLALIASMVSFFGCSLLAQTSTDKMTITTQLQSNGSSTVTVTLPSDAQKESFKAVLDGKDVTSRFSSGSCGGTLCETGTLSEVDGLRSGKNTVFATAKLNGGKLASTRARFDNSEMAFAQPRSRGLLQARDASGAVSTSYLPPTVAFNTLTQGGYQNGHAWVQIGAQGYPKETSWSCPQYAVIVLDRQTLVEKTAAPESSPYCAASSAALSTYLSSLPLGDLVIVGTASLFNADSSLNTTSIGGTNYSSYASASVPQGYMVIGSTGASPGQAFENYYATTDIPVPSNKSLSNPIATGMLVEDMNGNYNFQSSDAYEYVVSPNDSGYPGQSIVKISIPPSKQISGITTNVFTSGVQSTGGYYLLVLQRETLESNPNCGGTVVGASAVFTGCGKFFPTGDGGNSGSNATTAYMNLAAALNGVTRNQIAILTTVGNAAFANVANPEFQVANTSNKGNLPYAYFGNQGSDGFYEALVKLGAPAFNTMYLYPQTPVQTFTYVTAPGLGNSLSGKSVLSTSLNGQQGQTGYVHGLLVKDRNGLYRPGHTSQESATSDTANFIVGKVVSQQPVPWPELNAVLPGGSTVAAQTAAYNYISYALINYKYIIGAQGAYVDDLHYYFTGSNNTFIDYHYFDPASLPFPNGSNELGADLKCTALSASSCTWTDPVSTRSVTFTSQDFQAVAAQLHLEVVYLTNTMQYLVNGSGNMKDIIAGGSANTALALVGAATTIEGSSLQPAPSSSVKVDVGNVLSMVGAALNIAATVGTGGLVPPDAEEETVDDVDTVTDAVGDLLGQASSIGGGLLDRSSSVPSPDFAFVTEIGQLANSDLQSQMSAGFDSTVDAIVSDWSKLSQIGPQVTNTNNRSFYMPTQAMQNVVLQLISQGAQRSMYLSLVPLKYQVHYWQGTFNALLTTEPVQPQPDMGSFHAPKGGGPSFCDRFYSTGYNAQIPYGSFYRPSVLGAPQPFSQDGAGTTSLDWYILAGAFKNGGTTNAYATTPDTALMNTLFWTGNGGLNFPYEAFMAEGGPMDQPLSGPPSAFINIANANPTGYSNNSICSAINNQQNGGQTNSPGGTLATPVKDNTITTLSVPSAAVLGENTQIQAIVKSDSGAVPTGSVLFLDGSTTLGTAALDNTGKAVLTINTLALGPHSIAAYYITNGNFDSSASAPGTLGIYSRGADIALSLSTNTLQVAYGTNSLPLTMQLTSLSGMAGSITLGCSGLPVGMACQFNPSTVTLTNGSVATTSVTIIPGANTQVTSTAALLLLPLSVASLWGLRNNRKLAPVLFVLVVSLASLTALSGCSGGPTATPQSTVRETGSKLVLITASAGSLTRTIPLTVNIQ